ncbi:LysR family transcriptional regulator [Caballeronia sp. LZ035]|uniref:LysR family transcriptional regulator n=1 Tax=Caballeronia sp. LZ035 TaxID=3038568 RepID=UPI00285E01D5|nr:LysR family transcriptional regulator [Caballeronia sp. LZ035]MDR5755964.1 LysR family transcriptional regulator [Caballeronia sp. LZ035]
MLNHNALRQLDLQDVMVFLCLHKHRSARRSAEVLSISQPTVSYCLKRLRTCFQDSLFVLDHGSLIATQKADAIEPYLHTVIDAVNRCADMAKEQPEPVGRRALRMCAPEYFELLILPGVLEYLGRTGRETTLTVDRLGRDLPVEQLLAGEVDFAIGFGPGYHRMHPDLRWESILSDTFVCVTSEARGACSSRMLLDEFCDMEHVFPTPWLSEHNMIDAWLGKLGRSREMVVRANTYQACLNIVARLPLALALPKRLVSYLSIPSSARIRDVPLGFPAFTLDVVWAAEMENHPDTYTMRALFKDLASKSDKDSDSDSGTSGARPPTAPS